MEPVMTFAASATSTRERWDRHSCLSSSQRRAFTLIELLVVIGIIVVLIAIAVPMTLKAYRAGDRARTQADLNTIATGLEAFKADFGDYPRPDTSGTNTGFATLGKYLIGPFGDGVLLPRPLLLLVAPPDPTDPPTVASGTTYNPGDCVVRQHFWRPTVCRADDHNLHATIQRHAAGYLGANQCERWPRRPRH